MKNKIRFIILLLIVTLFGTGCSGIYTLKINSDFSLSDDFVGESSDTTNNNERINNINIYKNMYQQAFHYYGNLNNFYELSSYGVKVNNNYKTIEEYNSSDICKSFECNVSIEQHNDYNIFKISLNYDSFVFRDFGEGDLTGPEYVYFDVEFPFEVLETNSNQKLTESKYRWIINEEDLKNISIKYTNEEIKSRIKESEKKQKLIVLAVLGGYLIIIASIIIVKKNIKK